MTSGNSFSINQGKLQKDLLKRRLWVVLLVGIIFIAVYPIRLALVISAQKEFFGNLQVIGAGGQEEAVFFVNLTNTICNMGVPFIIFAAAAVFIAVQEFLFLFHRPQTDLHESLPLTRKQRFFLVYLNGIYIFLIAFSVSVLLCFITLGASGTLNAWVAQPFLFAILRDTLYFLAIYAVTCACVMLAGNAFYTLLLTAFVLVVPPLAMGMVISYAASFFKTYLSGAIRFRVPLNPFYHLMVMRVEARTFYGDTLFSGDLFLAQIKGMLPDIAGLLICILLGTAAAYLLYLKRRAEWAETTICYHPVQTVFKVVSSALAAIVLTYLIYLVFYYGERTAWPYGRSILFLVLIAAVCCLAAEALYRRSVNAMFRNVAHVPIACLIAVLFFLSFRADVFGYDRFMPAQSEVHDVAIVITDKPEATRGQIMYMSDQRGETSLELYQFVYRHMHLTDIEAVLDLMEESNRILREARDEDDAAYESRTVFGEILFRMENGREVKRRFAVDKDTDEALLARVFDTKEYLEGVEQVYHDEGILREMNGKERLTFVSDKNTVEVNGALYPEFAKRYRADLEDHYSIRREREEAAIGYVIYCDEGPSVDLQNGELYFDELRFPVYADDKETIAFLTEYDMMYGKDDMPYFQFLGARTGLTVEVTNIGARGEGETNVTYESGDFYHAIFQTTTYEDTPTVLYDETDAVTKEIFDASVCEAFLSPWYDYGKIDPAYTIYVEMYQKNQSARDMVQMPDAFGTPDYRLFFKGKVPGQVERELRAK